MKLLELLHVKERIAYSEQIPVKKYLLSIIKAFLITTFFAAPFLIVGINMLVLLYLYKSIWSIVLGIIVVYFICLSFWGLDYVYLKQVEFPKDIKKDTFQFMLIIATVTAVVVGIVMFIEVI